MTAPPRETSPVPRRCLAEALWTEGYTWPGQGRCRPQRRREDRPGTGRPVKNTPTKPAKTEWGLEGAHRDLKISPEESDEVAAELGRTLDFAKVPAREKSEVLAAFAAYKDEVTAGYKTK